MVAPAGPPFFERPLAEVPVLWEAVMRRLRETPVMRRRVAELRGLDPAYRADQMLLDAADAADALVSVGAGKLGLDALREACADVLVECSLVYLAACVDELDGGYAPWTEGEYGRRHPGGTRLAVDGGGPGGADGAGGAGAEG